MLLSHQWPATTAARRVSSPPAFAFDNGFGTLLQRLQELLKSDDMLAVMIAANAEPKVIGSIGGYSIDAAHLSSLLQRRPMCPSYDRRVVPQAANNPFEAASLITLARTAETDASVLSLQFPAGPHAAIAIVAVRRPARSAFTSADERVLQRHADWIADHVAMWWRLRESEQRRTGLDRVLDQVGLAMIMLDRNGHLIGTNRAAQALLANGDGLIAVGETLSAAVLEDAVRLHSVIGHALVGSSQGARAPVLTIRRKRRRPLIVAVLRVTTDPQPGETAIVLQVIEPDRDHDSAIIASCTLFGFTGAEARLAKLLVEGATLAEAASALRIQMPTARTYLKQAFAKSGTNRQAALVQTVLSSLVHPAAGTLLMAV